MSDAEAQGAVLILGGTAEARHLAMLLDAAGVPVVSSLAGRIADPQPLPGAIRSGGFGGPAALAAWLHEHGTPAVIDASHPYAAQISAAAARACPAAGVPLLRFERPRWLPRRGSDWRRVDSLAEAARMLPTVGRRALLTVGRQGVHHFAAVSACWFLIRCIERPAGPLPPDHTLLLARGPFALADERALLAERQIDVLVTKDSGGTATAAKLEAARLRGIPVIVVSRPTLSLGSPAPPVVDDVDEAVLWVLDHVPAQLRLPTWLQRPLPRLESP